MAKKRFKPSAITWLLIAAAIYFGYKAYPQIILARGNRKVLEAAKSMKRSLNLTPQQETEAIIEDIRQQEIEAQDFVWYNPSTWF